MRIRESIVCLIVLCAASDAAAQRPKPAAADEAKKLEAAKMALVEDAAKQAFATGDRNHNDILSKTEFPVAESLLEEGIMQLAAQGVLGQSPTAPAANQAVDQATKRAAANKAVEDSSDLYKKKNISLSEFQRFARALAAQADVEIAQNRAAYQAYVKQMNQAYRQSRYNRYRGVSGTPIFLGP